MTESTQSPSDTSNAAEAVVISRYRSMPSWRKFELIHDANRTAVRLAFMGLTLWHPGESESELRRRWRVLVLGSDMARRVYGADILDPK